MKKNFLKDIDWVILICVIVLFAIGITVLYSCTQNLEFEEFKKQLVWFSVSIVAMVVFICIDYHTITKFSPIIYGVFMLLLVGVLFTSPINGATSWFDLGFFLFQPGEFAKVFVVIFLTYVITKFQNREKSEINKPWKLAVTLCVIILPILLLAIQPDYGTAIAFLIATVFVLFVSGINKKYIFTAILLIIILMPVLYFFVLPEHAKTRIDVFLNPELDPRGAGYNIIQSKLAIGAGNLFGMGLLKGNQTQLGFLYPKTTDFIFSVIGEELGFVVSGLIVIVYVVLLTRAISIAKNAKDDTGSYIAIGIVGILFFHVVENIGMTIGLLPITGVPLPFISYGGSSLITNFICIGLLLNIRKRQKKSMFEK